MGATPLCPSERCGSQDFVCPGFRVLGGTALSFDGASAVGILDLLTLLANWGPCA